MELSFEVNTLDYPGAVSMGFMAKFLRGIDWWRLEPYPELVLENPSPYCAAVPGSEYVVYLRYGGAVRVDLNASSSKDEFVCEWIDLTESKVKKTHTVKGGQIPTLHPPVGYPTIMQPKDWLVHIKRK